ncbi:MAG: DUF2199 domain-containing protein [Saprospiraceae bacterium]
MKKYLCEICGKKHDVYYGVGSPEPDCMHSLSEDEKDKRVEQKSEKMLLLDKSFFMIKGTIFFEIKDISEWFRFEIWASIEVNYYLEKVKEYENGITDKPIYGKLENDVFFYENAKGAKVDVIFPTEGDEVVFEVLEENHPMTIDQKNGISKEQLIRWMQKMNHPRLEEKNKKREPFIIEFKKIINQAKTDYEALHKPFIIDVSKSRVVLFQILSTNMLSRSKIKNGFVIYLPFDTSGEEAQEELARFKKTKYFEEFKFDTFDGMPTYDLELENEKQLINYSKQIIQEVYQVDVEDIDFDIMEP